VGKREREVLAIPRMVIWYGMMIDDIGGAGEEMKIKRSHRGYYQSISSTSIHLREGSFFIRAESRGAHRSKFKLQRV
jgi:hypothetical protein